MIDICIIYDTRRERGATKYIVKWLAEELTKIGGNVDIVRVEKIDNFNYDLFIIGSPIYWERPLKSILNFLSENADNLRDKKTALFIVCLAEMFGGFGRRYAEIFYLKHLLNRCTGRVIGYHVFKGWLRKPDYSVRDECMKWVRELSNKAFKYYIHNIYLR